MTMYNIALSDIKAHLDAQVTSPELEAGITNKYSTPFSWVVWLRKSDSLETVASGNILHILKQEAAKALGYTVMLCTDVDSNDVQQYILEKHGWKEAHKFINKRTRNTVNIHIKNLD